MSHIRFSFVSNQVSSASNCGCSSPRPILCEMLEHKDEEDGMPEVFMGKNQEFIK